MGCGAGRSRQVNPRSGQTIRSAVRGRGPHDPGRGVHLGDTFGSMTERGTSAGDGSGPKTGYHLLTTDGGIVADCPTREKRAASRPLMRARLRVCLDSALLVNQVNGR